jgi:hypothetical protein
MGKRAPGGARGVYPCDADPPTGSCPCKRRGPYHALVAVCGGYFALREQPKTYGNSQPSEYVLMPAWGQTRLSRRSPEPVTADSDVPHIADEISAAGRIVDLCHKRASPKLTVN